MSEIIAYACSGKPNHLWSAAQFNSAAEKNRQDCDVPLVKQETANVWKAKSISRGKLLDRFRDAVHNICDRAVNEGDRVYLGSTNDLDYLKDCVHEMEDWNWDRIMRERDDVDPYSVMKEQRSRIANLEANIVVFLGWVQHWQADVAGNLKPTQESLSSVEAKLIAILETKP